MVTSIPYDLLTSVGQPADVCVVVRLRPGMHRGMQVQAVGSRILLRGDRQDYALEDIPPDDFQTMKTQPFHMYAFGAEDDADLGLLVDLRH